VHPSAVYVYVGKLEPPKLCNTCDLWPRRWRAGVIGLHPGAGSSFLALSSVAEQFGHTLAPVCAAAT
jgi:hypothetical protein